jgi:hypothetical protein
MSYPPANVSNSAGDSANVGAQAQVIHGGVHNSYYIPPGATARQKYRLGIRYLNGGVPSLAFRWIERAIHDEYETTEVRFYWLLALLSGRTSRRLSAEDSSRLAALEKNPLLYQADSWSDGIRAVLHLLNSLRVPDKDPGPAIDALERLHPALKEPIFQHLTVFLRGPRGDQIWWRDIAAAQAGRYAKGREKRAKYFFYLDPAEVFPRQPSQAPVSSWNHGVPVFASAFFVLAVLAIGGELIIHASIPGLIGFLLGCGGIGFAATNWVEYRWQMERHAEYRRRLESSDHKAAQEKTLAARIDQRFDWYLRTRSPKTTDMSSWLSATGGIRDQLRDEIAGIYQDRRVKIEALNWLIRYEVEQLVDRWERQKAFYDPPEDQTDVNPVRLWTGIAAAAVGGFVAALFLWSADPVVDIAAFALLVVSGYRGARRWTHNVLEHHRAAADAAESQRKYEEWQAAYETWSAKLRGLRPTDQQLAEWLECDKKVILKQALDHYGLKRSDVISYAFLETPSKPYDRASVRNGPWRYTRYKIIVFLLTEDGIRQVTYELRIRDGDIMQWDWQSYRYDALASIKAGVTKDGNRQEFALHLVNGQELPFRTADPLTEEWNPADGDVEALSSATEDATGLRNTLRILEGVAADGKGWITRETK